MIRGSYLLFCALLGCLLWLVFDFVANDPSLHRGRQGTALQTVDLPRQTTTGGPAAPSWKLLAGERERGDRGHVHSTVTLGSGEPHSSPLPDSIGVGSKNSPDEPSRSEVLTSDHSPDASDVEASPTGSVVTFLQSPEGLSWFQRVEQAEAAADAVLPVTGQVTAFDTPSAPPEGPLSVSVGESQEPGTGELVVHTDYRKAMQEAIEDRKLLLIYFHESRPTAAQRAFERETLANLEIREKLQRFVFVKLPRDAQINVDGRQVSLLGHPAFAEMLGRQGVAIVDLAHVRAEYYGHVVSTFPFTPGKYYRKEAMSIILDLPPGTLTQRTMIYAVRIHPEGPASTQGQFHTVLAEEAKQHANHQAAILLQGHHSWDTRFHRINAKLPGGVLAQEVVAESWPNESLVEACVDCVHSWRQSPGHWGAVRSRHPLFGYDIKRGRNGIWYATGIFGRR